MNDGLNGAIKEQNALIISAPTKELIQASVTEDTFRAYRRALIDFEV